MIRATAVILEAEHRVTPDIPAFRGTPGDRVTAQSAAIQGTAQPVVTLGIPE